MIVSVQRCNFGSIAYLCFMIDINALHALRAVAALGTLTKAADELGYTASAVSQQIKRLERQVGTPVLAQAGRGVVLTPAGRAMVESADEVFHALERCLESARSADEGAARGVVRVVGFSTAIRGLLAPALATLSARHPDLTVQIGEEDPDRRCTVCIRGQPTWRWCTTPTEFPQWLPARSFGDPFTPTTAMSS